MRLIGILFFVLLKFGLKSQVAISVNTDLILIRSHSIRLKNFDNLISQSPSFQYGLAFKWRVNKNSPLSFNAGFLKSTFTIKLSLNNTGWLPKENKVKEIEGLFPIYQIPASISVVVLESNKCKLKGNIGGSFLFNNGSSDLQHLEIHEYENVVQNGNFFVSSKYFVQSSSSNGFVIMLNSGLEVEYKLKSRLSLSVTSGFQLGTRNLNSLIVYYSFDNTHTISQNTDRIFLNTKGSGFSLGIALNYSLSKKG